MPTRSQLASGAGMSAKGGRVARKFGSAGRTLWEFGAGT